MPFSIRSATPHDAAALARLAGLDSRATLRGHALLAELNDIPVAAIGLTSGTVFSDPFVPTAAAVRELRARRYQILRQGGDVGPAWSLLRRLAPHDAVRTVRPQPLGGHLAALPEAA